MYTNVACVSQVSASVMDSYVFDPLYSKSPPFTALESPAFEEILDNLAVKMMNIPSSSTGDSPLGFENGSSTVSNSLGTSISSPLMPSSYGNYDISSGYNFSPGTDFSEQSYHKTPGKWNRREEGDSRVSAFDVPNIAEYGPLPEGVPWSKFRVGGKFQLHLV